MTPSSPAPAPASTAGPGRLQRALDVAIGVGALIAIAQCIRNGARIERMTRPGAHFVRHVDEPAAAGRSWATSQPADDEPVDAELVDLDG